MDIFIWLFGIAVAATVITNAYWLMAWVRPVFATNARDFVKAFNKKMPLIMLDDGKRWTFHVAEKYLDDCVELKEPEGFVSIYPNSMKYGKNILIAVGESHRGMTVDAATMAEINKLVRKGYRVSQIVDALKRKDKETDKNVQKEEKEPIRTAEPIRAVPGGTEPNAEPTEPITDTNDAEYELDWGNN